MNTRTRNLRRPVGRMRMFAAAAAAGIAAATIGTYAPAADAASTQQAVDNLNRVRTESGIPPLTEIDQQLSLGCRLHSRYKKTARNYRPGPSYAPHMELPTEPFHTTLGARAGASSMLAGPYGDDDRRIRKILRNPRGVIWDDAPAHFAGLLTPHATSVWYGDSHGNACMGVGGSRDESTMAPFYSVPGNGTRNVQLSSPIYDEWPSNPAVDAGFSLGETIGPFIYLFSTQSGEIESAELVGPSGPVEIRTRENQYVFIAKPLAPKTTYQLTVSWLVPGSDPWVPTPPTRAIQNVTFTTGFAPIGPPVRAPWRLISVRASGKRHATAIVDAKRPMAGRTVQIRLRWTGCADGSDCRPLGAPRTQTAKLNAGRSRIRLHAPARPRGATHLLTQLETKKFIFGRVAYGKGKGRYYRRM